MTTHEFLSQFSTIPIYNTKAVAQETGIPADTFRAWERRYGVPHPHRTDGGHRLYSERDIAIIRWLRDRTADGLTISQAIALMSNGYDINLSWIDAALHTAPHSWDRLIRRLVSALADFDEHRAEQTMNDAFALYALDDVLLHLLNPTVTELIRQHHQRLINATIERFALNFVRRKLFAILNTYTVHGGRGIILVGCAPGESHDIDMLFLAIFLVRSGWHIIYLGGQVPLPDLVETVQAIQPDMVCMSAASQETTRELVDVGNAIAALPSPAPHFGYTGYAIRENPVLGDSIPGVFLGDLHESVEIIAETLHTTCSLWSY
jgi:DNA-binding transcriptional MerR regulator